MNTLNIRIDDNLLARLKINAGNRGSKLSGYLRSLIEKGLIFENQFEEENFVHGINEPSPNKRLAELTVETLFLTRKLAEFQVNDEKEAIKLFNEAAIRSRDFVSKNLFK